MHETRQGLAIDYIPNVKSGGTTRRETSLCHWHNGDLETTVDSPSSAVGIQTDKLEVDSVRREEDA